VLSEAGNRVRDLRVHPQTTSLIDRRVDICASQPQLKRVAADSGRCPESSSALHSRPCKTRFSAIRLTRGQATAAAHMPFNGLNESGYGRFGGRAGIEAFTELGWISLQTAPRHYPF